MARIYIVDSDEEFAQDLVRELGVGDHEMGVFGDAFQALRSAKERPPDLVLLDTRLPQMTGFELCRHLRTAPALKSILISFLTLSDKQEDKKSAFAAGADDYLTKSMDLWELALRVQALLRRSDEGEFNSSSLVVGGFSLSTRDFRLSAEGRAVALTPVQFEIMFRLMSHHGEVFSSKRLLQEVWGLGPGEGNPSVVRWNIWQLRRRIEPLAGGVRFIRTVPHKGYTISGG